MTQATDAGTQTNAKRLLWAGFISILAAGVGFSVRGGILGQWSAQFGFTMTELGAITGGGLTGFGVIIILSSLIADKVGYGKLLIAAFILHLLSAVITLATPAAFAAGGKQAAFQCLFVGMFIFSVGNGVCEAVLNPLTATLFPNNKTHYLNILHAGWPAGFVIGGLAAAFMSAKTAADGTLIAAVPWDIQMSLFLIPVVIYGILLLGQKFPASPTSKAGLGLTDSMQSIGLIATLIVGVMLTWGMNEFLGSLFLPGWVGYGVGAAIVIWMATLTKFKLAPSLLAVFLIIHMLVGYVELGTDSWISKITGNIMASPEKGLRLMVYTSSLMFILRFMAGPIVHRISPLGLLCVSGILGALGLYLLGNAVGVAACVGAVTVYALGKTFLWPTMLAIVSEHYPKGGAVALGMTGGMGMLSAGLLGGPLIGYNQDFYASKELEMNHKATYDRYVVLKPTAPLPNLGIPEIKGLDGAKIGILENDGKELHNATEDLVSWWNDAKSHAANDRGPVGAATLTGSRMALKITALVPLAMAAIYLLLILYFKSRGGYKPLEVSESSGHN